MYRILGYADRWTVQQGETISFKVSSELPGQYRARLLRVRNGDSNPKGPGKRVTPVKASFDGEHPARFQETHAGSYVRIDEAAPFRLGSFTVQAWVMPTLPGDRPSAIMGTWNDEDGAGYGLMLDGDGALTLGARRRRGRARADFDRRADAEAALELRRGELRCGDGPGLPDAAAVECLRRRSRRRARRRDRVDPAEGRRRFPDRGLERRQG